MRILLFGANGQLGSECQIALSGRGRELLAVGRSEVDFTRPEEVAAAVRTYCPDIVVNAAAFTAVDEAEDDSEQATVVNGFSVGAMAVACAELDIPVIHISTDYVFDGTGYEPYREEDPASPINVYGESKLTGERLLRANCRKHLLLRTSWVFSAYGNNFLKTILHLAAQRAELGVVDDQYGCPTYAGDIARVIEKFIERYRAVGSLPWGLYHCTGSDVCSWYDFAEEVIAQGVESGLLQRAPILRKISAQQYSCKAARPAYSALDTSKLEALLQCRMCNWRKGVEKVCRELAGSLVASAVPVCDGYSSEAVLDTHLGSV